jgi:hypothetical protein
VWEPPQQGFQFDEFKLEGLLEKHLCRFGWLQDVQATQTSSQKFAPGVSATSAMLLYCVTNMIQ